MFDFHILKIIEDGKSVRATVITKLEKKVIEGLRKRGVNFEVLYNRIWTSGSSDNAALTVAWDTSPSERRTTRSSSDALSFSMVYETLCDSQGARMKTCCLNSPKGLTLDKESLTLEFDTWENAQITARTIQAKKIPSLRCNVHKPYQFSIQIPFAQFEVQKKQWLNLKKRKKKQAACIKTIIDGENLVTIQVEGKNRKLIGAANMMVEKIARGEILEGTHWHPSFALSEDSASFFQHIIDTTAVYLRCDPDIPALRLYGDPQRVAQARSMIQDEVQRREQFVTKTGLSGASAAFFKREGFGKLQELVGEDKVKLMVMSKRTTIMVQGTEEATHHFRRLLEESHLEIEAGHATDGPICPVCFNEVLYPERLACGHVYCPGCLKNLLTAVVESKKFPIVCIGDEETCNVPIALPFIRRFLPQSTFVRLLEAAFLSYLEQNAMQFQYCVTSGCRQIYCRQTSDEVVVLSCPSCLARPCSSCGAEHDTMNCEEYRANKDLQLQERLFLKFARSKGYRRCPVCKILVEKDGGCDNMYCRCERNLNWQRFRLV